MTISTEATVLCLAMSDPPQLPSGWFPDPHGRHEYRWFNGAAWTADVADDGHRLVDPWGAAPVRRATHSATGNGMATAAITCGLLAPLFAWMPVFVVIGIVLGVLAVVFAVRGRRRARQVGVGSGTALAGLIGGTVALVLSVVGIVLTVALMRALDHFMSPGPVRAEVVSCRVGPGAIDLEGSVTNLSDARRSYTVYGVVRDPDGTADLVEQVSDVEPGATVAVAMHRSVRVGDTGDCDARLVVQGPAPWGYDPGRIDD
jgi:hypothetical protein